MTPGWYLRRLGRMTPGEIAARGRIAVRQWWWSDPRRRPDLLASVLPGPLRARARLPRQAAPAGEAALRVVAAAERLLRGEWEVFGAAARSTDWFRDPLTGRVAPHDGYCFRVPYRDEAAVGTIKGVWELSRHQPQVLLACAWWLTGDPRFATRAVSDLRCWWNANPFLQGVHWVSGIEAGLRLLSWCWVRILLSDWPGASAAFEGDGTFLRQLYAHSLYLSRLRSAGSSANNHLIAELAGLLTASAVFPVFRESARWERIASAGLARQAAGQTHPDGWNREQASDYHLFVAEMLLAACLAGRSAGRALPRAEAVVSGMAAALAASLDGTGRPPRFGDGDDARGMLVDAPGTDAAAALLDAARVLGGGGAGWPAPGGSVLGAIAAHLVPSRQPTAAPRPSAPAGSGIAILRAGGIWLRCDGGPHGFGRLAAHGHADALSVELRHRGVEVFADPGTYCYHGEPAWRALFRGTGCHCTITVGGADQARPAGPFLWQGRPRTRLAAWQPDRLWQASHDGYRPVIHHRQVALAAPAVTVRDWITARKPQPVRLAFQLGPAVAATLGGAGAALRWPGGSASLVLPRALQWRAHRGEHDPPMGWYSPAFARKEPATLLAGHGVLTPGAILESRLIFALEESAP